MTDAEVITLSEITKESIAAVEGKTTGISPDLEASLRGEITTWNVNRNKVKVTISGKVDVEAQRLLNAITERVRVWLGFPALNTASLPGSFVVASRLSW